MKSSVLNKNIIFILFLFFSLSSSAQNQYFPQRLLGKITFLQKTLQSGNERVFSDELGYIRVIRNRISSQSKDIQDQHVEDISNRIKEAFTYLQFDSEEDAFKKTCYEITYPEYNELTKQCLSASWDGKVFTINVGGRSFDLLDKNAEIFEFGSVFVFEFDKQNNKLKLIDYGLTG